MDSRLKPYAGFGGAVAVSVVAAVDPQRGGKKVGPRNH